MKTPALLFLILSLPISSALAQNKQADSLSTRDGSANSAIFLNAESDSRPREVSLGLPTNNLGSVQIFEDGLPVSHYIYQLMPYKSWHGGTSAATNGLMSPFETAMRYGEINTFVDSYNKRGSDSLSGAISYTLGSYLQNRIDLNVSGPIAGGWKYSLNAFLNFDPGSNYSKFHGIKDSHQFYKAVLSKDFSDGNGYMSLVYQHVRYFTIADNYGPFIFVGDGSVAPFGGFAMGTDSYIPQMKSFRYMDFLTGEMAEHRYGDLDKTHHATFTLERGLADGVLLKVRSRFRTGTSSRGSGSLAAVEKKDGVSGYTYEDGRQYSGSVQKRSILQFEARETNWLSNAELSFASGSHGIRTGLDYQMSFARDVTSSVMTAHEVASDPLPLCHNGNLTESFNTSGEYYDGVEHKLAAYARDEWKISRETTLSGFLRLEYQGLSGKSANNLGGDTSNSRYAGFNLTKGKITPFRENFLNGSAGLDFVWRVAGGFSIIAQGIATSSHNTIYHYGGFAYPSCDPSNTYFAQAGFSYVNSWLNLISRLSYIQQTNFQQRTTFVHTLEKPVGDLPAGYIESKVLPTSYGMESFSWTTDAIISTRGGFNLHLQLILREPKYRKFLFDATFSDGVRETYDFSGKNVTGLHKAELSVEPSYSVKKWRFWLTARYISRQFINKTNTLYFNGRVETFGGIDFKLNDHFRFSLNVINILNQTGASGNIGGADLITDTSAYQNYPMSGRFIRPFTIELGVNVNLF